MNILAYLQPLASLTHNHKPARGFTANSYLQRDFAREWARSFAIKDKRPLGEDELVRLWRRKK